MNLTHIFDPFKKSLQDFSIFLKILIITAIIIGVLLRFNNLDSKMYSLDETFSTTNIFGRYVAEIIDVKIVAPDELQSYQHFNKEESLNQSIKRLVEKPYVFPPLYSIGMQIWSRFFSNFFQEASIINKSFSAFISLFSLGGMYWLCWELFQSSRIAWIGTALLSVSPLYLQYAQIVRTYSLTTAAILISSAALLRAIRRKNHKDWLLYAITIAFGLYSHLIFGFTLIAHGIYIILREKFRFSKTTILYLTYSSIGFALFTPWFILFLSKSGLFEYSVAQPVAASQPLGILVKGWINGITRIFVDLNDHWILWTRIFRYPNRIFRVTILLILGFCIFYLFKKGKTSINLFIFSLIIGGGGLLMFRDLLTGNAFSGRLRYMLTYVVGIQLIVVYGLYLLFESRSIWKKKLSNTILSLLIMGGILSCYVISTAQSWWAFGAPDYPYIANEINELSSPVVIYEDWGDALTMSYMLNENVYSHLTRQGDFFLINNQGKIYKDYSDIILFKPSKKMSNKLKQNRNWELDPFMQDNKTSLKIGNVWTLTKLDISDQ
ncbi:MAG: glycosyltransferase family 39 protein [Crocosphaera sp.]